MKWPVARLFETIHQEHLPKPQHMCIHAYLECVLILEIFKVLKARLINSSVKLGIVFRKTQLNHSVMYGDSLLGH